MLEVKNLVKIYKPKKGVPVTAINNISLKFPDKGMVFLLGKSGSGKSTLLNLLGGLDRYDGGEIVIKGVSSRDFRQQHFDSYRNTYVGFIFQEYNVLDDFTVGANIALAIELQGRKAQDSEIDEILKEVDLEGYGNRKPNELSGGQKQRVAIARALVKKPEIIMADEPTGALDSNTGKQVFDTLKKLSADKLVIVVSHDRDFAEGYADRIIELADGSVISDMEIDSSVLETAEEPSLIYEGDTIKIPGGYHLTDADREAINSYIAALEDGASLQVGGRKSGRKFRQTDTSQIKSGSASGFQLIKSKLPLKNAFKIGGSSLKYKKIRLVFTILLSFAAFTMFGLADTFGAYDHVKTCTNSIIDSDITYASIVKSRKRGSGIDEWWSDYGNKFSDEDIKRISEETGVPFCGVYVPMFEGGQNFTENFDAKVELSESDYDIYAGWFSGYVEMTSSDMERMGYKLLAGKLPDGAKNEIAISEYIYLTFFKAGYRDVSGEEIPEKFDKINGYNDIIGKTLTLGERNFTVTGVIDTGFDITRYERLTENNERQDTQDMLINYLLYNELTAARSYSYMGAAIVGEGAVKRLMDDGVQVAYLPQANLYLSDNDNSFYFDYIARLSDIKPSDIIWVDGAKTSLAENEVIISISHISDQFAYDTGNGDITVIPEGEPEDDISAMVEKIRDRTYTLSYYYYEYGNDHDEQIDNVKIVGIMTGDVGEKGWIAAVNDTLYNRYVCDPDGRYDYAVSAMPSGRGNVGNLVDYCYTERDGIRYPLQNPVTYELDTVNETFGILSKIFLYVGLGFAVFAALMLSNFIATSISHKKHEIGILRAIGSRSNDVFRIFFAESFIIAMINFVLSVIGTLSVTMIANYFLRRKAGILITVLNFGIRQIALLFVICLFVAAAASFIPVKRIASKKPIDAIRNR